METETKQTHSLGNVATTSGNPAIDEMSGAFVPPQTDSIAVVGGTGAAEPLLGTTVGGLPEIFSIATGITSSIASKMYAEALLRTLAFTSTTTRGTVLDTITYNPFSTSCVNQAAALYGSVHSQFTGDIHVSIETVANATLMGRIGIAYLPSLYPADTIVSPENLFLFDHAILDVSASGKGTFIMRPTTTRNFVVRKNDGEYYGKLVIIAFTDIANSYGTTMNIPLNIYSRLAPDAKYSGMDLSLITTPAKAVAGSYPKFPSRKNATLITESQESVFQQMFDNSITMNTRQAVAGQHHNSWGGSYNAITSLTCSKQQAR